jgi:5-(carboxyamino)imidazole ribonucleotide synthase
MQLTASRPTLGVVGGGQLGRMLAEAAAPLGVSLVVLDPTEACPAYPVAREQILGSFDDGEGIEKLADRSDALTFEIELADPDVMERIGERAGIPVHPSPDTLRLIQDKLVQKRALAEAGISVPEFRAVGEPEELEQALSDLGTPAMVKARRGGYDGRGNLPIEEPGDAERVLSELGGEAMVEAFVPFVRELSVIGVKGSDEVRTYVAGENVHEEEILRETVVPARTSDEVRARAQAVAREVLSLLEGRGTYGIELFETERGEILVNEIAPRPHNSGHWTIEGAHTSQFENHVRAVLGLPLGPTEVRGPTVSANLLGDAPTREARLSRIEGVLAEPTADLHWYGKREVRELRKMGHVTVTGAEGEDDRDTLLETARSCVERLEFEP